MAVAKYTIQRITSKFKPDQDGVEKENLTLKVGENSYLKVYDEKLFDSIRVMEGATVGLDVLDSGAKNERGLPVYRYVIAVVPLSQVAGNGNGAPKPAALPAGNPIAAPVQAPAASTGGAVHSARGSALMAAGMYCFNRVGAEETTFWKIVKQAEVYLGTGLTPS